jgi:competence protein ComEA
MNGKEKFAGAVLLLTLAIGIIIEVFDRPPAGESASRQVCQRPVASAAGRDDGFRKIDVNTATGEDLRILPGIGPKKAEAIVEYRRSHGSFRSLSEISEVRGIGPKTLDQIAPYVVVGEEQVD